MASEHAYRFSSFRFDPQNWRLRKQNEFRPLRPKTFAVLKYLLENAGQLVTKEELLKAVWPGITVESTSLRMCMNELRQALDDDPHRPRFVETVHRLGYRFIAPVALTEDGEEQSARPAAMPAVTVGREAELADLHECWQRACSGTRQIVFVAGEPGIGKTTLVELFLDSVRADSALSGRGQCAEQHGAGDAYFPISEALNRLCSGPAGREVREALLRNAPDWCADIPQLCEQQGANTPSERRASSLQMLSEAEAALTAIAAIRPVVLILEDLQHSDRASIELIAYLARQLDPLRALIIGTYRSVGAGSERGALGAMVCALRAHRQCQVVNLRRLAEKEVADYLDQRIGEPMPSKLCGQIYRRSGGNPLFAAAIVDHLESLRGKRAWPEDLRELGVPDNVRATIEQQIDDLSEGDRTILKYASVASAAGLGFSAAALASIVADRATREDETEEMCEELTERVNFLHATGIARWPDGTVTATYAFGHSLYQEVLYGMMSAGARARAHLRLANYLETAHGKLAGSIASELAMHFDRGEEPCRAAHYLAIAADKALGRGAAREALVHLDRGAQLLKRAAAGELRQRMELEVQTGRVAALNAGRFPVSQIEASMRRVIRVARALGASAAMALVADGMTKLVLAPRETRSAAAMIVAGLRQAEADRAGVSHRMLRPFQSGAHLGLAVAFSVLGNFRRSASEAKRAIETYEAPYPVGNTDTRVQAMVELAITQWCLGYPVRARQYAQEAVAMAEEIGHVPLLTFVLVRAAGMHGFDRNWQESLELAERAVALTEGQDLPLWRAWAMFLRGQARANLGRPAEGCRSMRAALVELDSRDRRRPPAITAHAHAALLEVEVETGLMRAHEAFARVQRAIDDSLETGNAGLLSDLYRMVGSLQLINQTRDNGARAPVERSFLKAIECARSQGARSFELRAALELGRLWQHTEKAGRARKLLGDICRRFTQSQDSHDLSAARSLLGEIG